MRKLIVLFFLLLSLLPLNAQERTAEEQINLVPFMAESFQIQGLRPQLWREQAAGSGVFVRAWDGFDLTAIFQQSREGTASEFLTLIESQFTLAVAPELMETHETESFTWSLYQFERESASQHLRVAMAIAEAEGRTFYILMQSPEVFFGNLYTDLFLPAVEALSPIMRYADPQGRFDVPIPTLWTLEEAESYAILRDEDLSITIFVSAIEGTDAPAAMQAFWETVYPNFEMGFNPDTGVRLIQDPARIGSLEAVYIVDWQSGNNFEGNIKQGVARLYEGVIYMTLIETTTSAVVEHDSAIAIVDNNFRILALLPEATPEATQDA